MAKILLKSALNVDLHKFLRKINNTIEFSALKNPQIRSFIAFGEKKFITASSVAQSPHFLSLWPQYNYQSYYKKESERFKPKKICRAILKALEVWQSAADLEFYEMPFDKYRGLGTCSELIGSRCKNRYVNNYIQGFDRCRLATRPCESLAST